ncbi:hypothetical protein LguiA_030573 [Lonicera macranthoides]
MCTNWRDRLVSRARPECRRAQQLVSESIVDPRTCEAVLLDLVEPMAELDSEKPGVESLQLTYTRGAAIKVVMQFKGGFMVDYGIGLGGVGPVLVQGGAKVDWFDPRSPRGNLPGNYNFFCMQAMNLFLLVRLVNGLDFCMNLVRIRFEFILTNLIWMDVSQSNPCAICWIGFGQYDLVHIEYAYVSGWLEFGWCTGGLKVALVLPILPVFRIEAKTSLL